jgi:hypothetical protein
LIATKSFGGRKKSISSGVASMKPIKFNDVTNLHNEFPPRPASDFIPEWYKKTPSYIDGVKTPDKNGGRGTIKKCIPVFDAITSGYVITTHVDVWVTRLTNGMPYYVWSSYEPIKWHERKQLEEHPAVKDFDFAKWNNPWAIETPKGYSCLIIPPAHRNNVLSVLVGVVDTDEYALNIEFPFVLTDLNFEGLIPAGTPIAQIIPFKRDKFLSKINPESSKAEAVRRKIDSRFYNVYKTLFWSRKEYK